jgi:3-methylfumaryl-CoA hydratase
MGDWSAWVGREEVRRDTLTTSLRARWCATLDRDPPAEQIAPQGLHWCLCAPDAQTAHLGRDGHPLRDESPASFLPPLPLERRMWAAGKVEFLAPLACGAAIERRSRVLSITEKQGATGPLIFVEVAHETLGNATLAVRETQTLVYRDAPPSGAPPAPPPPGDGRFDPAGWDETRTLIPGPALLFRYSALTFNSHRIHYDHPYATGIEGYRGLVVHGPLIASLLLDLARRVLGSQTALDMFDFRAVSPAMADEPLSLALRREGESLSLAAFAEDGRQIMAAKASPSA